MNLRQNQKGFTIVELLIVVVVIAILAAISIVAYTGITNRANKSAAMEAANSVKSVASAYHGENSSWPANKAAMVGSGVSQIAKLPNDINFVTGCGSMTKPSSSQGAKTVSVCPSPASGTVTGLVIWYWDYETDALTTTPMIVGDASATAVGTPLS